MITNQKIAEELQNYLQHKIALSELIDWAENVLVEEEFENKNAREVVEQLGLADVKAFGLQWEDYERFLNQLGYKIKLEFQKVA